MISTDNDKFYRGTQFQAFFKNSNRSLVLKADAPHFTILAVSDTYLSLTHKQRHQLLERGLFEVFPGSHDDLSEKNSVHSSFMRAITTRAIDELPIFKYEIYVAETQSYITEYWTNVNEPLLDDEGNVAYIINTTTNITRQIVAEQALKDAESRLQQLNEELTASNEELTSANEELTVANDELVITQQQLFIEANEKQQAIDSLKANEENLRNTVKQAPVGMCIVQGDPLFVVEVNDAFLEIIGKKREQFYDTPYWDVNAEAKAYYESITNQVLLTGESYYANEHEIMLVKQGKPEIVHLNFVYEPLKGADGKPFAVMIVAIDVTEQVVARKRIEASEKHFRSLADIVPAKISNALPSGEVTFFNRHWLDYSGMSFEDLRDFGYHQMMHPDEIPEFQRRLAEAAVKGVPLEMEMRFKDIHGNYRWHLNIASPVLDENGQITMWVGSTTDIQRMKEEDQQLQQLLNMLPASVVVIRGEDLVVEMINQSNLDYWKKTADEVIGRKFLDILPDLADQPFAGQLRKVMATGEVIDVKESPVIFENEDGTIRETFVDYTYQPLTDFNGNRNGVLVMSTEITDRVASRRLLERYADELQAVNNRLTDSNRELARSEQRFKYLIQEAPVAIGILTGRDLTVTSANAKILEVWGKTEAIITMPLASALPELQGQPFLQILDEVYTTGKPFNASEIRALLEHQGELQELFFNVVYQPIQIEGGPTTDILVVAVDVTEQVNSRKAVERAEESLRLAVEAADSGTYSINARTLDFVASPRLKELFGFKPDEDMPYKACMTQIREDYRSLAYQMVEAAINKGERSELEFPVIGFHDGKLRWLKGIGTLQHDSNGVDSYFTGIVNDITEQKEDEQRKNDFIGMVSHELKTPLTSLNAYLQMLKSRAQKADDAFTSGALDKSVKQVKKMSTMINGFLNLSRLESGKIHIDKRSFDMSDLVKEVEEESIATITSHRVIFEPVVETYVVADRDKIGQVINNFISNAVKYSPSGSTINIACVTLGNQAQVSVQDEGLGIKPEDQQKLFDRYYRVESNASHISGFGIGLYLCCEIVKRHQGNIWVESEVGKGSTFYFSLPLS